MPEKLADDVESVVMSHLAIISRCCHSVIRRMNTEGNLCPQRSLDQIKNGTGATLHTVILLQQEEYYKTTVGVVVMIPRSN